MSLSANSTGKSNIKSQFDNPSHGNVPMIETKLFLFVLNNKMWVLLIWKYIMIYYSKWLITLILEFCTSSNTTYINIYNLCVVTIPFDLILPISWDIALNSSNICADSINFIHIVEWINSIRELWCVISLDKIPHSQWSCGHNLDKLRGNVVNPRCLIDWGACKGCILLSTFFKNLIFLWETQFYQKRA